MTQIDNFRKVLGLPEPGDARETAAQVVEETPSPQTKALPVKEKNKTLLVKQSTHDLLSSIIFWQRRTGIDDHPTMDKLIREMTDEYLAKNPEAKRFVYKY